MKRLSRAEQAERNRALVGEAGSVGAGARERSAMLVGIHFMNFSLPGGAAGLRAAVGDTAVAADEAGVAWFTAMDHWFQMEHFATARAEKVIPRLSQIG